MLDILSPSFNKLSLVDEGLFCCFARERLSIKRKYIHICDTLMSLYIYSIIRHFIVRYREHLGINKKGVTIKGVSSSISDHINETAHVGSLEDFCIIDKANNNFDLLIMRAYSSLVITPHLINKTLPYLCISFNSLTYFLPFPIHKTFLVWYCFHSMHCLLYIHPI